VRREWAGRATRRRALLLALVAWGACALVGCARATPPVTPAGRTAAPAAPATEEPLRVGTSGDYPPFSSIGADGARAGFDIEVAGALAERLGRRAEFVAFRWPELSARGRAGDFDIVASGVTIRPERALLGRFTRPYAVSEAVVLVRRGAADQPTSLARLDQPSRRIAVNRGGYLEGVARATFARARVEPVEDNLALAAPLLAGRADALVTDSVEERELRRAHPELVRLAALTRDRKALFVPDRTGAGEAARHLHAEADRWLIDDDAEVNRLRRAWLGPEFALTTGDVRAEAIVALIDQRLGLMPWVAAFKRAAHQPITDAAREREVLRRSAEQARTAGLDETRATALFAVLIEAAKDIQRAAAPLEPSVDLARLRAILGDLDQRLVAELAAARGLDAEGRARLASSVEAMRWPGLGEVRRREIATAALATL